MATTEELINAAVDRYKVSALYDVWERIALAFPDLRLPDRLIEAYVARPGPVWRRTEHHTAAGFSSDNAIHLDLGHAAVWEVFDTNRDLLSRLIRAGTKRRGKLPCKRIEEVRREMALHYLRKPFDFLTLLAGDREDYEKRIMNDADNAERRVYRAGAAAVEEETNNELAVGRVTAAEDKHPGVIAADLDIVRTKLTATKARLLFDRYLDGLGVAEIAKDAGLSRKDAYLMLAAAKRDAARLLGSTDAEADRRIEPLSGNQGIKTIDSGICAAEMPTPHTVETR